MDHEAEAIRPTGYNERRCISRESLGLYGSIITVGTYVGPSRGPPSRESLVHDLTLALKHTVRQHPVLGTVILLADTDNPVLCRTQHLDLRKHLRFLRGTASKNEAENLRQLLAKAHNEPPFGYDEPQWRVFVAPVRFSASKATYHFNLGFACSHALADGISAALFHTTFLKALRDLPVLSQDSSLFKKCVTSEEPLPPSLNKAAKMPISLGYLARGPAAVEVLPKKAAGKLGALLTNANKAWYGSPSRPAIPKKNRLLRTSANVAIVSNDIVQAALATCKKNGARLTGFLNHAMARALSRALHSRGREYRHFVVETAMDLRRLLPQGQKKMINYVAAHTELLTVGHAEDTLAYMLEDWSVVQKTTESLSEASNRLRNQPVAMLKFLKNYRAYNLKKARTPAEGSFISSNLGVFDGRSQGPRRSTANIISPEDMPQRQEWEVEQMAFSQSANGTGSAMNLNVVSAVGGNLVMTMTWWANMLGVEDEQVFAQDVMDDVVGQLTVAAAQARPKPGRSRTLVRRSNYWVLQKEPQETAKAIELQFRNVKSRSLVTQIEVPPARCTSCGDKMVVRRSRKVAEDDQRRLLDQDDEAYEPVLQKRESRPRSHVISQLRMPKESSPPGGSRRRLVRRTGQWVLE